MPSYRVRTACEILGIWRETGAIVEATAAQVAQLVPPLGNVLEPVHPLDHDGDGAPGGSLQGGASVHVAAGEPEADAEIGGRRRRAVKRDA